jgi:hypothetical protein
MTVEERAGSGGVAVTCDGGRVGMVSTEKPKKETTGEFGTLTG